MNESGCADPVEGNDRVPAPEPPANRPARRPGEHALGGPVAARWRARVQHANAEARGRWFDDLPTAFVGGGLASILVLRTVTCGYLYGGGIELPHPGAAVLVGAAFGLLASVQAGRPHAIPIAFGALFATALDGIALHLTPAEVEFHEHGFGAHRLAVYAPLLWLPGLLVPLARGKKHALLPGAIVTAVLTLAAVVAAIPVGAALSGIARSLAVRGAEDEVILIGVSATLVWYGVLRYHRSLRGLETAAKPLELLPWAALLAAIPVAVALWLFLPLRLDRGESEYARLRTQIDALVREHRFRDAGAIAVTWTERGRHSGVLRQLVTDLEYREGMRRYPLRDELDAAWAEVYRYPRDEAATASRIARLRALLKTDPGVLALTPREQLFVRYELDWIEARGATPPP